MPIPLIVKAAVLAKGAAAAAARAIARRAAQREALRKARKEFLDKIKEWLENETAEIKDQAIRGAKDELSTTLESLTGLDLGNTPGFPFIEEMAGDIDCSATRSRWSWGSHKDNGKVVESRNAAGGDYQSHHLLDNSLFQTSADRAANKTGTSLVPDPCPSYHADKAPTIVLRGAAYPLASGGEHARVTTVQRALAPIYQKNGVNFSQAISGSIAQMVALGMSAEDIVCTLAWLIGEFKKLCSQVNPSTPLRPPFSKSPTNTGSGGSGRPRRP